MTSPGNCVVVWEWMNEYGRWRPYDPHTANFIESSQRKSPSVQVNLGKVAPNMGMYSIDFLTMCQIRFGTGTARPVRRQLYPDSSPPGKGIIWQWEGDVQGQWNSFDMEVACLLEDHFSNTATQNTELNLSKTAVKLPYIMNLSNMTQKRIETGRLRTIRRELLSMPYLNSVPSDGTSSSSGATHGQSLGTSAVNGPSSAKRQRIHVSGNGQVSFNPSVGVISSNSGTTGPITRKRLYTRMMAQNAPLPTSAHMNSAPQIPSNQISHSVPQPLQVPNQITHSVPQPLQVTNQITHSMPQSLQVSNQNGQIMPVQNPHSLNQTQIPSGISSSGFIPHHSMFQRSINFIHGNISHRMGLAGGNSNSMSYHSLPNQPMGGLPNQPMGGLPNQPMGGLPSQPMGGLPSQPMGGLSNQPMGGLPSQPMGGLPNQPMGGLPNQPMGGLPSQPMGGLPNQPMGGLPSQPMGGLPSQPMGGSNIRPHMTSAAANLLMSAANSLVLHPNTSAGVQPPTSSGAARGATGFYLPSEDKIPNNVSRQTIHSSGKWAGCEVFENYVSILDSPPNDEDCCICCEKLTHPSGYGEGKPDEKVVFKLCKCGHMFHKLCILAMYESSTKNGAVQCPTCKTIYGEKHGNCPDGVMEYLTLPQSLPGNEDYQTKIIIYHISPGIQGPEHPHPGKRYTCRGFPRVCYIPDSDKGRKVLKLLIVAWRRRLTFTIGQSSTTGESDTVTWNEIHHKTESGRNHSGHGYPDNKYLDNVLMELNVHGVTEADLSS